jgi:hypothetical protein
MTSFSLFDPQACFVPIKTNRPKAHRPVQILLDRRLRNIWCLGRLPLLELDYLGYRQHRPAEAVLNPLGKEFYSLT